MAFPAGFGWGASTAAYQVEGRRSSFPFARSGMEMTSLGSVCVGMRVRVRVRRQKEKKERDK